MKRRRRDPWAIFEWVVVRVLVPFGALWMLAVAIISFFIDHAAYGMIFLVVFAILALIWAHEQSQRAPKE